jgi:NADPH:quinone reductase-like Zn-dependent oxidoreductase
VDKVLNGVAGETANELLETLRSGGRMVDLTGSATAVKPGILVDSEYVVRADAAGLGRLARMIDDALPRVEIQRIIPFERARSVSICVHLWRYFFRFRTSKKN